MLPSQEHATVYAYLISLQELRPLYPLPVLIVNGPLQRKMMQFPLQRLQNAWDYIYPLYLNNTVSHAAVPYAALSLLWYKEAWLALLARWRRWTRWTSSLLSLM